MTVKPIEPSTRTNWKGVVYVLHCFHKKSTSGIATPQPDLDLIESRLKDARTLHKMRTKKADGKNRTN